MIEDPIAGLASRLPRHWRMLDALRTLVLGDERWRWLELGCSVGAGGGDEHSDLDVAIGYELTGERPGVEAAVRIVATGVGEPLDLIVHRMPGMNEHTSRLAAEYPDGVQLDLVMMPARSSQGLPDRTIALVDKDGILATDWVPSVRQPPDASTAHEWLFLGWWALSNANKYMARESWFEAVEAVNEAQGCALRLFAAGQGIPYPSFGLVSLLDFPPFELPGHLADTYANPADPASVAASARSCADLLTDAARRAGDRLGIELTSGLRAAAAHREQD